jgi:hypothetical protein
MSDLTVTYSQFIEFTFLSVEHGSYNRRLTREGRTQLLAAGIKLICFRELRYTGKTANGFVLTFASEDDAAMFKLKFL